MASGWNDTAFFFYWWHGCTRVKDNAHAIAISWVLLSAKMCSRGLTEIHIIWDLTISHNMNYLQIIKNIIKWKSSHSLLRPMINLSIKCIITP